MDPLFDCRCGRKVKRIIYRAGEDPGCDSCIERRDITPRGILHHQYPNRFYNGKMTQADRLHIVTRKQEGDGRVRPDWRWR